MLQSHLLATLLIALAATVALWGFRELKDIEREATGGVSRLGLAVALGHLLVFLGVMGLLASMLVPQRQDPVALFGLVLLLASVVMVAVLRL